MPIHATGHPTPGQLRAFAGGLLGDAEALQLETHLDGCTECQCVLDSLPQDDLANLCRKAGSALAATPAPADTSSSVPACSLPPAAVPADLADHPRGFVIESPKPVIWRNQVATYLCYLTGFGDYWTQ